MHLGKIYLCDSYKVWEKGFVDDLVERLVFYVYEKEQNNVFGFHLLNAYVFVLMAYD